MSIVGVMVSALIMSGLVVVFSKFMSIAQRALKQEVAYGERMDLKQHIRESISCRATVLTEGLKCGTGSQIALYKDHCLPLASSSALTSISDFQIKATCSLNNSSFQIDVVAGRDGKALTNLFPDAPLICEPIEYKYKLNTKHQIYGKHVADCAAMGAGWKLANITGTDEIFHMYQYMQSLDLPKTLETQPYISNTCSDIMDRFDVPPNLCRGVLANSPRCANKPKPEPSDCSSGKILISPWAWEWPHIKCPPGSLCLEDTTGGWKSPGYYGLCEFNQQACSAL